MTGAGTAAAAAAPRILIVRLSALGDVVMASGLLPALRARHPRAHIAWLVEPAAAPLLRHNPRLDRLIVWPRDEWKALWRARRWGELVRRVRALRAELRAERFDIALDAQGLLKSGLWAWASGAPRRVSLGGREGSRWLATEVLQPPPAPRPAPIGWEYRVLARHLGAPEGAFRLDLAIGEAPRAAARAALDAAGVAGRHAVIAPHTTRPQKHWFDAEWAALAARLADAGLRPVLLGGPGDAPAARRIVALEPRIVDLAGALKLDASAAVVESAALLVGVDTGLTHMGSALGVPTVALFGSTRPYLDGDSALTRVLDAALPCAPCRRHPTCGGRFDCMRAHRADDVAAVALSLRPGPRAG